MLPDTCSVLIVDDHPLVRVGVRSLLPPRWTVLEAADPDGAMARLREQPVALLLLDLALGATSGLGLLPRLATLPQRPRVIVLSSLDERAYAERALQAGADGFVSKAALADELLQAIATVLAGRVHVGEAVREVLLRRRAGATAEALAFTPRELEVLQLVAAGRSTREIAEALNRSVKTIETHKQALKAKLGAESPAQLLRLAIQHTGTAL
jgi:DNA-binding NarL/FixJ family response regulator